DIDAADAAIRRVHCSNEAQTLGEPEALAVLEVDHVLTVLEEVHELAEHLGKVAAVHLVNEEDVWARRLTDVLDHLRYDAIDYAKGDGAGVAGDGTEPVHEFLIRIARMELHEAEHAAG